MSKFKELRVLDVSKHTEKKGKFTYLSWAWAVDTLLQHDSKATWTYAEPMIFSETVMVFCSVTAFNGRRFRRRPLDAVLEELEQIPQKRILFNHRKFNKWI